MRSFGILLTALSLACAGAQTPALRATPKAAPLPALKKNGAVAQMMVDGKPFLMLAGELHNSSASSIEYMKPVWSKLSDLRLNTVIGTVSWELLEPQVGKLDFTLVDAQIREARQRNLRLVLIWFATWKNGNSSYAPLWVKADPQRFPLMQTSPRPGGAAAGSGGAPSLTPFGEATLAADSKAFRALMRHIREIDPQRTVIMMQVENESGLLGDSRDRSPLAEAAWSKPVPAELMDYLAKNKETLAPGLSTLLQANGGKTAGAWAEVFGTNAYADEIFMAWNVGRYVGKVAEAGKAELGIPMYANAWLGPQPGQTQPGQYPSGGPASRVLDVWNAAAPAIDLLAPDIYVPDFKAVCATYARAGRPLFIPEARGVTGNLFWALGQHAALGWSPFGIEDAAVDGQVAQAYKALGEMAPQLARWQADGKVAGLLVDSDAGQTVSLGGYRVTFNGPRRPAPAAEPAPAPTVSTAAPAAARAAAAQPAAPRQPPPQQPPYPMPAPSMAAPGAQPGDNRPFGLIVSTGPDEFLLVGSGLSPSFTPDSPGPMLAGIASIDEGRFEKGTWIPGRRLNGDEFRPNLRPGAIGMLKVKLYRHD